MICGPTSKIEQQIRLGLENAVKLLLKIQLKIQYGGRCMYCFCTTMSMIRKVITKSSPGK